MCIIIKNFWTIIIGFICVVTMLYILFTFFDEPIDNKDNIHNGVSFIEVENE